MTHHADSLRSDQAAAGPMDAEPAGSGPAHSGPSGKEGASSSFPFPSGPAPFPPDPRRRVHLVVRPGVELLDLAGPGQVLATAGYPVEVVAVRPGVITSQGFLRIEPTGILGQGDPPHIVVVPGGSSETGLEDPELIQALAATRAPVLFSVCTGALLLAAAGRLAGLEVTTWHGALSRLRALAPGATVVQGVRFTDNVLGEGGAPAGAGPEAGAGPGAGEGERDGRGGGTPAQARRVITSAGVSAGIDAALHLVSVLDGEARALAVARYMEYPWPLEAGR
jgi:transcriptional regulator GlxA family with amidase domain